MTLSAPFARSGLGLSVAALLGPFWLTQLGPSASLTVGTVLVAAVALLFTLDFLRYRPAVKIYATHAALPAAAVAGFVVWTFINASLWGCLCGTFHALVDLAGAFALALCLGTFASGYRSLVLAGAAGGVTFAGALALLGVKTLHSPFGNTAASTSTQLYGIYGNPNYLGYAVAFAIPIVLAQLPRSPWRVRAGLLATLVFVIAVIGLTYSRGALLAASAGALAALITLAQTRRRRAVVAVGALLVATGAAALAFPYYGKYRTRAVFGSETVMAMQARDASGWDGGPQGLISGCCSSLSNLGGGTVLRVNPKSRNGGVSYAWGTAKAGLTYELTFKARSAGENVLLRYGLEDNQHGNGTAVGAAVIDTSWRRLRLHWVPTTKSTAARLYVWVPEDRGPFSLADVTIARRPGGAAGASSRLIPTDLAGVEASSGSHELDKRLSSYTHERFAGVHLAADAFVANPLRGIGWEEFPTYASAHGSGKIPTHDEYLRIASELGAPGVLFLTLLAFATIRGLRRCRSERSLLAAAAGVTATGCVGLLFVNGLTVSAASLPLALAVGLICAPEPACDLETPKPIAGRWLEPPGSQQP